MWAGHLSADQLSKYMQCDFAHLYAGVWEGVDLCTLVNHAPVAHRLYHGGLAWTLDSNEVRIQRADA